VKLRREPLQARLVRLEDDYLEELHRSRLDAANRTGRVAGPSPAPELASSSPGLGDGMKALVALLLTPALLTAQVSQDLQVIHGETATFRMNDEEVRVFHVPPAHTDGDVFVYFVESDVLHTGDVFRTNMYPIVDVYNGGSVAGMIEAMQIAIDLAGPENKVIPGHGFGFTDRDGLIEFRDMLTDLRDTIRDMVGEGLWLDEVLAARPSAPYDARWRGTESWSEQDLIPIIYSEVGGAASTVPRD
jgi:glyoxylase-like metal-dependent hydrolase (beta-lactamase superfamily II)